MSQSVHYASLQAYQQAASIIHAFLHYNGSIKSLTLHHTVTNKPLTTRLCVEALKHRAVLLQVLKHVNNKVRKHEQLHILSTIISTTDTPADIYPLPVCGALVLLYDTLIGSLHLPMFKQSTKTFTDSDNVQHIIKHKNDRYGFIHATRFITTHMTHLRTTLTGVVHRAGVGNVEELLPVELRGSLMSRKYQRYVRINTLKTVKTRVKQTLGDVGYTCIDALSHTGDKTVADGNAISPAQKKQYCYDTYVPNLLQFPADDNSIIHSELVENNDLIIQDKSSCLPCLALNPQPDSIVIDACAAPGNKSSLCAALMNNTGTVYAVERDSKRCKQMRHRMSEFNATSVDVQNCSFLDVDPTDARNPLSRAQYILLDPSCSGSGTVNADQLLGAQYDTMVSIPPKLKSNALDALSTSERVQQLHDMQVELLKHAMLFKHVERISYSTCSVYELENERVVHDILPYAHQHGFKLAHALPKWSRRGLARSTMTPSMQYEWHNRVVRVDPVHDNTGGFFVAVFTRTIAKPDSRLNDVAQHNGAYVDATNTNNKKRKVQAAEAYSDAKQPKTV